MNPVDKKALQMAVWAAAYARALGEYDHADASLYASLQADDALEKLADVMAPTTDRDFPEWRKDMMR